MRSCGGGGDCLSLSSLWWLVGSGSGSGSMDLGPVWASGDWGSEWGSPAWYVWHQQEASHKTKPSAQARGDGMACEQQVARAALTKWLMR